MSGKRPKSYAQTHCSHYVLGECSQEHNENCPGTDKCIKALECQFKRKKQALDNIEKIARRTRDNYLRKKSFKNDYYDAMIFGLGGFTEILDIINKAKEVENAGRR